MKTLSVLLVAIGLASCALPKKALIIAEGPKEIPREQQMTQSEPSAPSAPVAADDGLRMPDMLTLPDEDRLRSSAAEKAGDSTVITRPPSE